MPSFVHARAVLSAFATISAILAPVCIAHADEPAPSTSTSTGSNGETDDARFRRFKAEGDRAAAERRLNDAIKAYDAARKIRRDPLTAGRMGLVISFFNDPRAVVEAASLLYEAVSDAAGVSSKEKDAFFAAYKRVRKQVCKLEIDTNDANAKIDLGDGSEHRHSSFFVFVKKGMGEGIAQLEGREDIRKTWDCTGDHDIELKFDFPPAATTPAKTITVIEKGKETVKIIRVPNPVENPIADPLSHRNRISILFGSHVVFGVAPSPAYGLSISGAYKFGNWSAMLGARGAYAFGPIKKNPLDVFAFTALAGPCFREKWFSACGYASMNVLKPIPTVRVSDKFATTPQVTPGLGIGVGGRYSVSNNFGVYLNGDATILSRDVELLFPKSNGVSSVWQGDQFLITMSLGVEFAR